MMGGTTRAAISPRREAIRLARGGGLIARETTVAGGFGSGLALSTLRAGIFIWTGSIGNRVRAAVPSSPEGVRRPGGSSFEALDEEALQIRVGVLGIEHLAVEEGLFAAR